MDGITAATFVEAGYLVKPPSVIGPADLAVYVETMSDFGFELQVLRALIEEKWTCEHGGTYDDPISGKPRQFDLRVSFSLGHTTICLAIECKHLRPEAPLLLLSVPRVAKEAFHNVIVSRAPVKRTILDSPLREEAARVFRLEYDESVYRVGSPVGKSCAQVWRDGKGSLKASDSDVYEKWSQAVASSRALVKQAERRAEDMRSDREWAAVIPIVVVPDETLWHVHYDGKGVLKEGPVQLDHLPFFIERQTRPHLSFDNFDYNISHLEFATRKGLLARLRQFASDARPHPLFPRSLFERSMGDFNE